MNEQINNDKKALWVSSEFHKEQEIFKAINNMSFEKATQYLIKLGVCAHELEKQNGAK